MPPQHVILYPSPHAEEFCPRVWLMNPYSFSKTQFKCHVSQEVCPGAVSPSFYCSHSPRSSCLMSICVVTGLLMTYHRLGILSCIRFFATPWAVARRSYLSVEFSRQKYWTGLPFPSPRDFSLPGAQTCVCCTGRWILYCLSHKGSLPWTCCALLRVLAYREDTL